MRENLCNAINDLNLTGVGAEIGVHEGEFSDVILSNSNLSMLISIDTWPKKYPFNQSYQRLKKHGNRSAMLRQDSLVAAKMFPDNFFDFIYLDSKHSYDQVKQEIELYWPKLKSGGIFSGHDYMDGWTSPDGKYHKWGVIQAVDEFVKKEKQILNFIGNWRSWWLIKEIQISIL